MKCLQKKYNNLEEQCKAAVRNFTEMTMTDPTLDFLLMKACEPMIQLFCPVNKYFFFICINYSKCFFFLSFIEYRSWKRK